MSEEEELPSNQFARAIEEVGFGELSAALNEQLQKVVQAVQETSKEGSLTLVLTIKPRGRESGQVELAGEVKPKIPQHPIAPSMFFANEDGALQRENPRQRQLPFGDAPKAVKTV